MAKYSKTAEKLLPHLLQELQVQPVIIAQAGGGGAMAEHALFGDYHTGILDESQAPWAVTATTFGAHEADPDAHHNQATVVAPVVISGQQISLSYAAPLTVVAGALDVALGDGVEEAGGSLRVKRPTNSGLALDSSGLYVNPYTLNTTTTDSVTNSGHTHAITTTTTGTPATIVALDSNGYTQAARWVATDRVRTPLLDTASGDMTVSPAGDLTLNPGGGEIFIPGADTLRSSAWTSGVLGTGWGLQERGGTGKSHLDIRSIYTDELIATTFTADQVRVRSGSDWLGEALAIAARDNSDAKVTIPNVGGGSVRIYVEDAPEVTGQIFSTNEYVLIKTINRSSGLVIRETWGQVSSYIDEANGRQSYSWTTVSGSGNFTLEPGTALTGFGVSSGSYIFRTVIEAGRGPFERFATWSTNPYTPANRVSRVEIGDIKNAAGDSTTRYGIAAGNNLALTPATGFSGFTADSVNGAKFYNGSLEIYSGSNRDVWIAGHGMYVRTDDHGVIAFASDLSSGVNAEATEFGRLQASNVGGHNALIITAWDDSSSGNNAQLQLLAYGIGTGGLAQINLYAGDGNDSISLSADTVSINGGTAWHSSNDGAGSGLDADKLDTYEASAFGRLAAANTWSAQQSFQQNGQTVNLIGSDHSYVAFYPQGSGVGRKAYFGFPGASSLNMALVNEGAGSIYFATNATTRMSIASDGSLTVSYAARFNNVLYVSRGDSTVQSAFSAGNITGLTIESFNSGNTTKYPIALSPYGGGVIVGGTNVLYSAALSVIGNIHSDAAITAENFLQLKQRSGSPGSATGFGRIYYDSGDDRLKYISSGGTVRTLSYT